MRARFCAGDRPSCSRHAELALWVVPSWKRPKCPVQDRNFFRFATARAAKPTEHPLQGAVMGLMAGRRQGKRLAADCLTTKVQSHERPALGECKRRGQRVGRASGMPMPRLMSRCGRVISSMARCPMIRLSSIGMGRMWDAGARISPLRDASCCGALSTCWCLSSGATTICIAVLRSDCCCLSACAVLPRRYASLATNCLKQLALLQGALCNRLHYYLRRALPPMGARIGVYIPRGSDSCCSGTG